MKYVFGLAGDPITLGHIAIVKSIHKHLDENDELYIMVSNNDEKQYHTSLSERFDVINQTMKSLFKTKTPIIVEQHKRTYSFLQEQFNGQDSEITIVVGEDEWNALLDAKWHNYDLLLKTYSFMVARRKGEGELRDADKYNVKTIKLYDCDEISSTKVREIFYRNPEVKYKEVQSYINKKTFEVIKENGLYNQNGDRYEEEMEEFLKEYAIKKEQNHWGEPSVTTDVVAYNGDQILLIRRKNKPYQNYFCLPGGFFEKTDADLDAGAAREFREETTLDYHPSKFEQIKTYGHNFDPRMKICDVAFSVRIHAKDMDKAVGSDDAAEAKWFNINDLPPLGFHHAQIIRDFMKKKNFEDEYFENLPIDEV